MMIKNIRSLFYIVFIIAGMFCFVLPVQAADIAWDNQEGAGDSNWSTVDNWEGNVLPGTGDNVIFNADTVYNCTVDQGVDIVDFTVLDGYTGEINAGSQTLNIAGNWTMVSGATFTARTSTVIFDATASKTLSGPMTGSSAFYNLYFDSVSGTWALSNDLEVTNVLNINAGELNVSNKTIELTGSGTPFLVSGTFNSDTSTVQYTSFGNTNITAANYYNLAVYPVIVDPTFGYNTIAGGNNSFDDDVLGANGSPRVDGVATSITVYVTNWASGEKIKCALYDSSDDSFIVSTEERDNGGTGWQQFNFSPSQAVTASTNYLIAFYGDSPVDYYEEEIAGEKYPGQSNAGYPTWPDPVSTRTGWQLSTYCTYTPGPPTYILLSGTFDIDGDLTIGNSADEMTVTADANNPNIDLEGVLNITANSTFVASASGSFNVSGDWTNSGIFTHSDGTVTFNGSSAQTVTSISQTYNNIIVTNAHADGVTFADAFTTTNFTDTTADSKLIFKEGLTFTINGTLDINGGTTGDEVIIDSENSEDQFTLAFPTGAQTISYTNLDQCIAGTNPGTANHSIDGGDNTNWTIVPVSTSTYTVTYANDHKAYQQLGAGAMPPQDPDDPGDAGYTECTEAQYNKIDADDTEYNTWYMINWGYFLWYDFTISESKSSIVDLDFKWVGLDKDQILSGPGDVSYWNHTTSAWVHWADITSSKADHTHHIDISADIDDYIDGSGHLHLGVYGGYDAGRCPLIFSKIEDEKHFEFMFFGVYEDPGNYYSKLIDIRAGKQSEGYLYLNLEKETNKFEMIGFPYEIFHMDSMQLKVIDTPKKDFFHSDKEIVYELPLVDSSTGFDLIKKADNKYYEIKSRERIDLIFEELPEKNPNYQRKMQIVAKGWLEIFKESRPISCELPWNQPKYIEWASRTKEKYGPIVGEIMEQKNLILSNYPYEEDYEYVGDGTMWEYYVETTVTYEPSSVTSRVIIVH